MKEWLHHAVTKVSHHLHQVLLGQILGGQLTSLSKPTLRRLAKALANKSSTASPGGRGQGASSSYSLSLSLPLEFGRESCVPLNNLNVDQVAKALENVVHSKT